MARLSAVAAAGQTLLELPLATVTQDAAGHSVSSTRAEALQRFGRCRQTELQDFAAGLAEESPLPFVIYWGVLTPPQAHVLLASAPTGGWHARVCTDEELAHWLHAMGMYIRARQRQYHRQTHANLSSGRVCRPLSPPLACW